MLRRARAVPRRRRPTGLPRRRVAEGRTGLAGGSGLLPEAPVVRRLLPPRTQVWRFVRSPRHPDPPPICSAGWQAKATARHRGVALPTAVESAWKCWRIPANWRGVIYPPGEGCNIDHRRRRTNTARMIMPVHLAVMNCLRFLPGFQNPLSISIQTSHQAYGSPLSAGDVEVGDPGDGDPAEVPPHDAETGGAPSQPADPDLADPTPVCATSAQRVSSSM